MARHDEPTGLGALHICAGAAPWRRSRVRRAHREPVAVTKHHLWHCVRWRGTAGPPS